MKKLSEIHAPDDVVACECSCQSFFDWGIQIAYTSDFGRSPRAKEFATHSNVKVCMSCHTPIVIYDGDIYDASEYVSAEQIQALIERSEVPVPVMDP